MPFESDAPTIANKKIVNGYYGILAQVPRRAGYDAKGRPWESSRFFYSVCCHCGLTSGPKRSADRAFKWLNQHLADPPQSTHQRPFPGPWEAVQEEVEGRGPAEQMEPYKGPQE